MCTAFELECLKGRGQRFCGSFNVGRRPVLLWIVQLERCAVVRWI